MNLICLFLTNNLIIFVFFFQALIHGLNRHYYSIAINYRKNELEEKMLLNLHKKKWTDGLILKRFDTHSKTNEQTVQVCKAASISCMETNFLLLVLQT